MQFIEALPEITADGSHTLRHPVTGDHYHSTAGAAAESRHVYIDAGLKQVQTDPVRILEMGFGTGLNALLTLQQVRREGRGVVYHTAEAWPLSLKAVRELNYAALADETEYGCFLKMHEAPWDREVRIADDFTIAKLFGKLETLPLPGTYDLVYYDAFAFDSQPELWSVELFSKIYRHAKPGAILVTYAAKGEIKRALRAAGFEVHRLPGAPGKHHMLRAVRPAL